jgi:hypothetical protein
MIKLFIDFLLRYKFLLLTIIMILIIQICIIFNKLFLLYLKLTNNIIILFITKIILFNLSKIIIWFKRYI